jgi:5-methylthioadenosine/S-adenosylhomocysteine deaminase
MDDYLIKNATLWAAADAEPVDGGSVLVRGGRIAAVGRKLPDRARTVIDAGGSLVMPGLVQTHAHLCQTLFRGLAEDLPLLPWLRDYIWPLEAAHNPDSLAASARLACAEMLRGGTTAFLSMETVHGTSAVFDAVADIGIMGVIGHCLMDETGGYDALAVDIEDGLAYCDVLQDHWGDHDTVRLAVAPRFALSCSGENMALAAEYARGTGLLLHTHASEQVPEVELVREQTGMANILYLDSVGLSGPDVCLAHCVHTTPEERELLRATDTRVLHCPSANLKLGSGCAPVPEYLEAGIAVSIGADGAPCNNRLDAFLEMREAALIQKPRLGSDALAARDVVDMATRLGARTLGMEDEMGTLEVGKRANLILVDRDALSVTPGAHPATDIVYGHASSDVLLTMVNGRILYEDGRCTTIDEDALRDEVRAERKRLVERAGI